MKKFMRTQNQSGIAANPAGPRLRPAISNGQATTNGNGHSHNGNGHMYSQNGHANGHGAQYQMKATKLNGHANGALNGRPWLNGFAGKPEDKQSTLSRYWTTERSRDGDDYQSIRRTYTETGALWEDPDFVAGPKALYKHKKPPLQPIVWMRPHEMCTRPLFRGEGPILESTSDPCSGSGSGSPGPGLAGRFSVDPGELGDPHLLAAAASLAFTPKLLDRVVPAEQDFQENYCGMFRFRFWHFGEWKEVLVDDRLPTYRGRLVYLHSANSTEFWAALLEKAYAKLYGNYENLQAGSTTRSLQDLTGGIVQSFGLSHQDRYLTFQVLNSAVPRSSLLIATITHEKDKRQLRLRNGLITAQAYSVTGLARVRGVGGATGGDTPLVRLRNPTGRGEWAGAWSRASWEWHGLSDRDKELLSVRVTNDGEFWMSFEDFARVFTCLELVHVGPDDWMSEAALHAKRPWRAVLARRRWRAGYNAGGGPQYLETTAMNPQFHVQIPRASANKCHVVVSVTQHYETRPPGKKGLIAIGFAVYEVPPAMPRLTMHYVAEQKPLDVTNHSVAREVVTFFTLPPGDYIVVPQTNAPNIDAKFLLRILTDEQSNIWEVNEDNMVIRNISTEFLEDRHLIPTEVRATLARLLGKREIEEVDAAGLRRALRRCWRTCLAARPSLELCRSLVMLRDSNISGRIPARDIPPLLHVLQFWKHVFQKYTGSACASKTSSYNLRALLWAAGVTASNKVLECLVLRFAKERVLTAEAYVMAMVRLHLAHERYHNLDTKMKTNPLSLEEMILMTIYS